MEMYLDTENFAVHGLVFVGVRAILSAESERGSPFNVQRSLLALNFAMEEVEDLFGQYRKESGQEVDAEALSRRRVSSA